jgi:hypothetical protein
MLGGEAELRWRFLTYQFNEDQRDDLVPRS